MSLDACWRLSLRAEQRISGQLKAQVDRLSASAKIKEND